MGHYARDQDGVRISSQAFSDRSMRPSVDREAICGSPTVTQNEPDNGVLRLIAREVRAISAATNDAKGKPVLTHLVDVHPDPLPATGNTAANPAHAEVRAAPVIESNATFRRILERLARLSTWEIVPKDVR